MSLKRPVYSLVCTLLFLTSVSAQTAESLPDPKGPQTELQRATELKAIALLEDVIANAQTLKSASNRIRIQIAAGDLIWPRDEVRARAILDRSIKEFIELIGSIDETDPNYYNAVQAPSQLYSEFIEVLTRRDPKMALDFLHSARVPRPPQAPSKYLDTNAEAQIELQIASQIALTDPKLALQTALGSLDKGFSSTIVGLISAIQAKDREGAAKVALALVRKLLSENLLLNNEAAQVAVSFLNTVSPIESHGSSEDGKRIAPLRAPILIDPQSYKELFDYVLKAALSAPLGSLNSDWRERNIAQTLLTGLSGLISNTRDVDPARLAALQRKLAELRKAVDPGSRFWQENQELIQNGSVDDLLALALKSPPEMRDQVYQQASWKAAGQGEIDRARQIITDGVSNPMMRRQMLDQIDRQAANTAAAEGKIEQARQVLSRLHTNEERGTLLIQLAGTLSNNNDKAAARRLLEEARGLVSTKAENFEQIQVQLQLARTFIPIDSAVALELFEQVINQFNELLAAAEVLNGFDQQYFKDGELMWQHSSLSNYLWQAISDLGSFPPDQFDRAKDIAGKLQRPEVRIMAQLSIARAALAERTRRGQFIDRHRDIVIEGG
ncbi:MAG: hypothetical protein QOJ64_4223 [Acidobacteriota bacterium]|nr:hypothetical protein [Acidobacteriota bacterium]